VGLAYVIILIQVTPHIITLHISHADQQMSLSSSTMTTVRCSPSTPADAKNFRSDFKTAWTSCSFKDGVYSVPELPQTHDASLASYRTLQLIVVNVVVSAMHRAILDEVALIWMSYTNIDGVMGITHSNNTPASWCSADQHNLGRVTPHDNTLELCMSNIQDPDEYYDTTHQCRTMWLGTMCTLVHTAGNHRRCQIHPCCSDHALGPVQPCQNTI
jgi:hypothetical protein